MIGQSSEGPAERTVHGSIRGTIVEGGVVCPLIRLPDGTVYSLMGIGAAEAPVGRRMTLEGRVVPFSTCQQGESFQVTKIIE